MTRAQVLFFALLFLVALLASLPELLRLVAPAECPVPAAPIETLLGGRS